MRKLFALEIDPQISADSLGLSARYDQKGEFPRRRTPRQFLALGQRLDTLRPWEAVQRCISVSREWNVLEIRSIGGQTSARKMNFVVAR